MTTKAFAHNEVWRVCDFCDRDETSSNGGRNLKMYSIGEKHICEKCLKDLSHALHIDDIKERINY